MGPLGLVVRQLVPRSVARLSIAAARRTGIAAVRSQSCVVQAPSCAFKKPGQAFAFSTSTILRKRASGQADKELELKLAREIEFEEENSRNEPVPASIKDYLDKCPFEIQDIPGKQDVVLRRQFGNEKITVTFTVSDLTEYDPSLFEDDAAGDEDPGGAEADQASPQASGQQADEEGDGVEEEADDEAEPIPCKLSIVVEKPGHGALSILANAQQGTIIVDNLSYYKDAAHAHRRTAEAIFAGDMSYPGPPFGSLDEDLQVLMERYLEERGVTSDLARFVPEYIDMKEQKEYLTWLENIKGFVVA